MAEFKVGDSVWWTHYSGFRSGTVAAVKKRPFVDRQMYLLEHSEGWDTVEDPRVMFPSLHEVKLHIAQKKQQEASQLLMDAANLFKEAGIAQTKE